MGQNGLLPTLYRYNEELRPHCRINGGGNKICIDWKMKMIPDKGPKTFIYLLELHPPHEMFCERENITAFLLNNHIFSLSASVVFSSVLSYVAIYFSVFYHGNHLIVTDLPGDSFGDPLLTSYTLPFQCIIDMTEEKNNH